MIYSLQGKLAHKKDNFAVLEAGGIGFRMWTNSRTLRELSVGEEVRFFCHLHAHELALELYGFLREEELLFFEQLIGISGIGPKSALAILEVAEFKNLLAAIKEGRPDLLVRASGVGRKTADRIILELRGKIKSDQSGESVKKMESDADLVETLASLGYSRDQARSALEKVTGGGTIETRLKEALKLLSGKK